MTLFFSTKNNLLSLFAWVGIETHFPMKCPVTNLLEIIIHFVSRSILKRDVSSTNNFALEDKSPDQSFL